ncbi:hypothetical protein M409DRAFT_29910 [Zasmidium cellare ATCC 36951]|uniref:MYND-type domain-containing protein n=1 Tax=Zasmidium cellare ATCC 36951 TaxID=1080233 RepID=A0A6A6C0B0_ZASCE|nr:uncharacterized protein M409DRAFT_29910 [Zasmidium cellare ATCC 36951]KAF2159590.1 hypothetical protein M409DRAFT_29910 [Zasmidium cellare ATCC 36951]
MSDPSNADASTATASTSKNNIEPSNDTVRDGAHLKDTDFNDKKTDNISTGNNNAPTNSAGTHCGHCSKPATLQCAGCRNIKYCNTHCQKQDWRMHKSLCKTFADFTTSPGRGFRRVIVLPRDSNEPRFAWMETWVGEPEDDEDYDSEDEGEIDEESGLPEFDPERGSELGYPADLFNFSFRSYNEIIAGKIGGGEHLDHCIAVYLEENHGYPVNQCLDFLTHGKAARELGLAGKGLLVIYCTSKCMQPKFVRDANCSDLRLGISGWFEYNILHASRKW